MVIIKLNSCNLASFISKNEHYKVINIFYKLWKKYFKNEFDNLFNIENTNNKINLNIKKLDLLCNESQNSLELNNKKKNFLDNFLLKNSKSDYFNNYCKIIIKKYMNRKYGIIREKYIMNYYNKLVKKLFININQRYKKVLSYKSYHLYLIGRVDGINIDGKIIEFKNRIYKLNNEIKEYEWIQIQSYMDIYNINDGELVEYYCCENNIDNLKIHKVDRDINYWNNTMINEINKYYQVFIDIIINSNDYKMFFKLSANDQNEYIKKIIRDKYF